jgi:ribosome-associated protein
VVKGTRKAKKSLTPRQKALIVAEAAEASKCEEPVLLNVSKVSSFTDYFLITHGNSTRHVMAIAENIMGAIKNCGSSPFGVEGQKDANWVLIDWGEVIAHVFYGPAREFYELEKLWADARRLKIPRKGKRIKPGKQKSR